MIERASLALPPRRLHLDPTRLCVSRLGNSQAQHALAEFGADLVGVELAAQREGTAVACALDLGMAGRHPLWNGQHDFGIDQQALVLDTHVEAILGDARQVSVQGDAGRILDHVYRRQHGRFVAGGRRRVGRAAQVLLGHG